MLILFIYEIKMFGRWSVDFLLVLYFENEMMMRMMSGMKSVPGGSGLSLTLCTAPPGTQNSSFIIQNL